MLNIIVIIGRKYVFNKELLYKIGTIFSFVSLLIVLNGCRLSKGNSFIVYDTDKNNYCELKKFSAKYVNNKMYINWIVNTNIENYYFLLEKSRDGKNYFPIYATKGLRSPVKEGLLYSYIDTNLISTSRTYRLRAVQPIKNEKKILLYADKKNLLKEFDNAEITIDNNNFYKYRGQ